MRWFVSLLASLALLTACGSQEGTAGTTDSATDSATDTVTASAPADRPEPATEHANGAGEKDATPVPETLDFTATALDGSTFDGASLAGSPAVLWFWAPWCPTCRAQIPNVTALAKQYDGKVAVVGVGGLDSAGAIEDLAADIPHVTHLVDDAGEVWQHFEVTAQSTFTVLDADGEVVSEGYLTDDSLNTLVEQLADGA
ncbi:redoxin domain-containing protein [Nocardioides sp. GY 10113]|uniref:TlpA family protein disulfide reductase n=1 Tax=Nocardioides sp. GY 10113 TaxID=2569761 RepID=UPI0010A7536E|nr:redoxin family protein [Nocardioides sp. GY 10113]TIC89018.1 redoxin domain-containing protein [Nocardioides sp. GY 10113]